MYSTRQKATDWWDGIPLNGKLAAIQKDIKESFSDAVEVWNECQGQVTDEKIEEMYLSEHPQEQDNSSKHTQEIENDYYSYFNTHRRVFDGINAGKYLDEEDFEIWGKHQQQQIDAVLEENKDIKQHHAELALKVTGFEMMVKEMNKALKPLADMYENISNEKAGRGGIVYEHNKAKITVGDLARAHVLYSKTSNL